jgi:hypothetical protein
MSTRGWIAGIGGAALTLAGLGLAVVSFGDLLSPGADPASRRSGLTALVFMALPMLALGLVAFRQALAARRSAGLRLLGRTTLNRRIIHLAGSNGGWLTASILAPGLGIGEEAAERELRRLAGGGLATMGITHAGEVYYDFRRAVEMEQLAELEVPPASRA